MSDKPNVWIVDDEVSVLRVTEALLASLGEFEIATFESPSRLLLEISNSTVDCVLSDLAMPEMDGGELQKHLRSVDPNLSILFLTGRADIPKTIELIQNGAITLLEKPYQADQLTSSVRNAVQATRTRRQQFAELNDYVRRIVSFDEDELDVMFCILGGISNKTAAFQLSLSSRTFDRRRHKVFQLMQVESPAELAIRFERCRPYLPESILEKAARFTAHI